MSSIKVDEAISYVRDKFYYCILVIKDEDCYPFSVPIKYKLIDERKIMLDIPDYLKAYEGKEVNLVFNSITPLPQGGYAGRRYVIMWGTIEREGNTFSFVPFKAFRWDENIIPFPQYVEERTSIGRRYLSKLKVSPWIPRFWFVIRFFRLPFLVATLLPILTATMIAFSKGFFDPILLALTLIGASAIHIALNIANDYFDHTQGADKINVNPTPFSGGSRMIQYGFVKPSTALRYSYVMYLIGASIGIYLTFIAGLPVLIIGILGVMISYFYTSPPLKFSYRGLGEIMVGIGFGPVLMMGAYYVQARSISLETLLISISVGTMVMLILYVNEIPDRIPDRLANKLTLVARMGKKSIIKGYLISVTLVYLFIVLPILLVGAPLLLLLSLITTPLVKKVYTTISRFFDNPYGLIPAMSSNIKFFVYTTSLIILAYLLNSFLIPKTLP